MGRPWALISFGIGLIAASLSYLLAFTRFISYTEVIPLTIAVMGMWLLLQSLVKGLHPAVGEMSALTTAGWGLLVLAIGIVGDLSVRGYPVGVLFAGLAILLGGLTVLAAFLMWIRRPAIRRVEEEKPQG